MYVYVLPPTLVGAWSMAYYLDSAYMYVNLLSYLIVSFRNGLGMRLILCTIILFCLCIGHTGREVVPIADEKYWVL